MARVSFIPNRRNSFDVKQSKQDYAVKVKSIRADMDGIFSLDEKGIQIFPRSYGRSRRGIRACSTREAIRSEDYFIEGVISSDRLCFLEIMNRPYNSEPFVEFLVKLIEFVNGNNVTGAHLIMDNVASNEAIGQFLRIDMRKYFFLLIHLS